MIFLLWIFFFKFVFVFAILTCLCLTALWSPAGKGLTSFSPVLFCCVLHIPIQCPGSGVVLGCNDS